MTSAERAMPAAWHFREDIIHDGLTACAAKQLVACVAGYGDTSIKVGRLRFHDAVLDRWMKTAIKRRTALPLPRPPHGVCGKGSRCRTGARACWQLHFLHVVASTDLSLRRPTAQRDTLRLLCSFSQSSRARLRQPVSLPCRDA